MTKPLSPAAQAMLDAYWTFAELLDRDASDAEVLAAALRAAAVYCTRERRVLMTIAAELEAQP